MSQKSTLPDRLKVLIWPDLAQIELSLLRQNLFTAFLAQSKHVLSPGQSLESYQARSGILDFWDKMKGIANKGINCEGDISEN